MSSNFKLVDDVFQKMKKSIEENGDLSEELIAEAMSSLEKARGYSDDDENDEEDNDLGETGIDDEDLSEGYRTIDPNDEQSDGDDWLRDNDPAHKKGEDYEEYADGEDDEAHRRGIDEDLGDVDEADIGSPDLQADSEETGSSASTQVKGQEVPSQTQVSLQSDDSSEEVEGKKGRFRQPSREELVGMRGYTRPWEQRAREASKLQADPSKNPVLAHQGNIIEARNQAHGNRKSAYQQLVSSDEYKNADPVSQMEMDDKFESQWRSQNPEHLKSALSAHDQAHKEGKRAHDVHAAAKDAQIKNILSGGTTHEDAVSTEEGLQHAGGIKGEEGTEGAIRHDPASSFAMGNQDFIRQYAQDYSKKGKKPANIDEMMDYNEGSKRDIGRILGNAPSKDPKFEQFFSHYYPLIGMSAHRTLKRLGLDPNSPDVDMSMLHEAGMHGLIQAVNDYEHENPSKASFSTHAGNKIRGLQMTAMRGQDHIPSEVRRAQKKFMSGKAAPVKSSIHDVINQSKHPAATDIADRLKRANTQRSIQGVKPKAPQGGGTENGNN